MNEQESFEFYQDGRNFAQEVQEALAQGKSFEDMHAFPPAEAAHVRDIYKDESQQLYMWWKGYVSRWD